MAPLNRHRISNDLGHTIFVFNLVDLLIMQCILVSSETKTRLESCEHSEKHSRFSGVCLLGLTDGMHPPPDVCTESPQAALI